MRWIQCCVLGLVALTGCQAPPPTATEAVPRAASVAAAPARVVTLSPALTEITFAIGGGDRVIGVSDHTIWPAAAADLPRLGAFINPNLELLAQLQPDLVVVQGQAEKVRTWCEQNGQQFVAYKLDNVQDVLRTARDLGRRLDCQTTAEAELVRIQRELDQIQKAIAGRPAVKTFVSVGRADGRLSALSTAGAGTFLDDLVTLAGGRNVFGDSQQPYPQPSLEALLERAPEVILDLHAGAQFTAAQRTAKLDDWQPLAQTPAVKAGRVVVLDEDYLLMPSPRLTQTARLLARALHPDTAGLDEPAAAEVRR